jgi:hypothetical protein
MKFIIIEENNEDVINQHLKKTCTSGGDKGVVRITKLNIFKLENWQSIHRLEGTESLDRIQMFLLKNG